MKLLKALICLIFIFPAFAASLYDFKVTKPNDEVIDFKSFKGKPVLIVNIATQCGFSGQLGDLEELNKKYGKKGLIIIGIPSNDFAGQTPESNKEVVNICKRNYGVTFPISTKMVITGSKKAPLYKYLVGISDGDEIGWNFTKFLFDKNGKLIERYSAMTNPSSSSIKKKIEKALK